MPSTSDTLRPDSEPDVWRLVGDFAWGAEVLRGILLGLAIVAVVLVYQQFGADFALIDDDAISSWQPIFTDFARQLSEGRMPVWSHHTSCGYPILGWPQPSYVYPPLWLAHAICLGIGLEAGEFFVATLMHLVLGAAGAFVLSRRFGVHPIAAAIGAISMTMSGIMLGLGSSWPTYGFATAYWPLFFLAIEELRLGAGGWRWTLILALLGGMAFLFADLLLVVKIFAFVGFYAALRLDVRHVRKYLTSLAIAGALAFAIGVGQTIPSAELVVGSPRMGMGSNEFYTCPPLLWLGFVYPFWTLPWEVFEFSRVRVAGGFFVGPCALLGAAFAIRWFRPLAGPHRVLLGLFALYLGLALGDLWLPNGIVQKLPIFGAIRWPMRWMFEASCALALVSGFGLHLAFRDLSMGRGRGLTLAWVAVAGFLALINFPPPPGLATLSVVMIGVWAIGLSGVWRFAHAATAGIFLAVVFAWTCVALIANVPVAQQTRMAKMTRLLDAPLTVGRDTDERVLFLARHAELVSAQKEGNLARSFPHQFGTRSVLGYVYRPPSQAWMDGFELDGLIYEKEADLARRFLSEQSTMLATLRVGHVVVFKNNRVLDDACAANPRLVLEAETDFYRIYRNTGFKAPAFLVRELRREENRDFIVSLGLHLEMPEQALIEPGYDGPMSFSGAGSIANFHEHHDQIAFDVATTADAFVVVTTTYFPRWRATIDAQSVPLHRVNGSFMGLRIPPGTHAIRLEYRPTDHLMLLAISAAALTLTSLALVGTFMRRGSTRESSKNFAQDEQD